MNDLEWKPLDFNEVKRGDIVRHVSGGKSYVVDSNYGDRITAITSVDITNPSEWEILCLNDINFYIDFIKWCGENKYDYNSNIGFWELNSNLKPKPIFTTFELIIQYKRFLVTNKKIVLL